MSKLRSLTELVQGVWQVAPVAAQSHVVLVRWQVMQLPSGERMFVGYAANIGEGRTSSAVVTFDVVALRGVTKSGRVYELEGPPGYDEDALHVWLAWLDINHHADWTEVTQSVWEEHCCVRSQGSS